MWMDGSELLQRPQGELDLQRVVLDQEDVGRQRGSGAAGQLSACGCTLRSRRLISVAVGGRLLDCPAVAAAPLPRLPQRQVERRSCVRLRFRPHPAPVLVRDALNDGQARSVTFELIGAVQTLKHAEQLSRVSHLESHAVVLDPRPNLSLGLHRMDREWWPVRAGRVNLTALASR